MEKECFQDDEDDTCCRNDGGKKVNTVQTCEDVIFTMVLSHVHNAVKLYQWCLHFLCVHYNDVCRSTPKLVKVRNTSQIEVFKLIVSFLLG